MAIEWNPASVKPDIGRASPCLWVRREMCGVELAEFNGRRYQSYGASCDREGLDVEDLTDVTHWAYVAVPEFDRRCLDG